MMLKCWPPIYPKLCNFRKVLEDRRAPLNLWSHKIGQISCHGTYKKKKNWCLAMVQSLMKEQKAVMYHVLKLGRDPTSRIGLIWYGCIAQFSIYTLINANHSTFLRPFISNSHMCMTEHVFIWAYFDVGFILIYAFLKIFCVRCKNKDWGSCMGNAKL